MTKPKTLASICVSRVLAEELKAAGYPQESLFYWVEELKSGSLYPDPMKYVWNVVERSMSSQKRRNDGYAAPTSTEVLEVLSQTIKYKGFLLYLRIIKNIDGKWSICYWSSKESIAYFPTDSDSLPSVGAKMYLYLAREGVLKL